MDNLNITIEEITAWAKGEPIPQLTKETSETKIDEQKTIFAWAKAKEPIKSTKKQS